MSGFTGLSLPPIDFAIIMTVFKQVSWTLPLVRKQVLPQTLVGMFQQTNQCFKSATMLHFWRKLTKNIPYFYKRNYNFVFLRCHSLALYWYFSKILCYAVICLMLLDIAKYEKVYIIDQNYSSTLKYVLFCKMKSCKYIS